MFEFFESTDQFKSTYNAFVHLIPVVVVNSAAGNETIKLKVSGNKSLPGVEDAEEWEFKTDDPEQEIAEKIIGKLGSISELSFEVPYDPILLQKLVAHAKTRFTARIIYDDAEYDEIYRIDVLKCFVKSPGSAGGTANNSAPNMTIKLQPRGGGKLADSLSITKAPRA